MIPAERKGGSDLRHQDERSDCELFRDPALRSCRGRRRERDRPRGGGVSRGQGVAVACLDRAAAAAEETAARIRADGGAALALAADVTADETVDAALDRVETELGQIHGLVNCAGVTGRTNIKGHEVEMDDFDLVYRINLRGAMVVSKAVLPRMLRHGYGRLLHIASIAGKEGNAGMAAYSATKAGLIGLVKSLAKDYAETGVTINALAPAVIRTPLVEVLPEATVKYMTDKIPMKRCGTLEEAAPAEFRVP